MGTVKLKDSCKCPSRNKCKCKNPWWAQARTPGGRAGRTLEGSFPTETAASEFVKAVESTGVDPRLAIKEAAERRKNGDQQTFAEFFDKWLNGGRRELAPSSKATYLGVYKNHYAEHFGKKRLCDISPQHILDWVAWEKSKGYKPYGIEVREGVLASVFRHAVEMEVLDRNPAAKKSPRKRDRETSFRPVLPSEIPTKNQFLQIADDITEDLRLSAWLMGGAGLRVGESLAVAIPSFDFDKHLVTVDHKIDQRQHHGVREYREYGRGSIVSKGTKWRDADDVPRVAPLVSPVERAALWHIDSYGGWGDRDWLLRSPRIKDRHPTYQYFRKRFHIAEQRVAPGRDFTPKALRHFFVTELINRGVPVWSIAQIVGHRTTDITERVYAHFLPRSMTDLIAQLVGWLDGADAVEAPTDDPSDAEARLLDGADLVLDS